MGWSVNWSVDRGELWGCCGGTHRQLTVWSEAADSLAVNATADRQDSGLGLDVEVPAVGVALGQEAVAQVVQLVGAHLPPEVRVVGDVPEDGAGR